MPVSPSESTGEVTRLLAAVRAGDASALDRMMPLVYEELRMLARRQMRREYGARTLHATALVHEAYIKLVGSANLDANNRAHFLAIMARAMRQVLIDAARKRNAQKRGAGARHATLWDGEHAVELQLDELLALDAALQGLDERQRQIVEYRFFAGLEEQEIAAVLNVSDRTVRREWVKARAWLYRHLYPSPRSTEPAEPA
ncbi:MAG: ECF-type sigma factor [Longimicrobiales bacterium]